MILKHKFYAMIAISCFAHFPLILHADDYKLSWERSTDLDLPMAIISDQLNRPYLYLALKSGGFAVWHNRKADKAPEEIFRFKKNQLNDMDVMNMYQLGNKLYLALGGHFSKQGTKHAGLAVLDISKPEKPRLLDIWKSPKKIKGAAAVVSDGKTAFLGAMSSGVIILNVSKPSDIRYTGTYLPDIHFPRKNPNLTHHPNARGFALKKDILFVANDAGGLHILDVRDPAKPKELSRYINQKMIHKQQAYNNILISNNIAYIPIDYAGLEIVDISNPRQPKQLGWWNPWEAHTIKNLWFNCPGHTNQITMDSTKKLVYLSAGDSELLVVDVSNPAKPALAKSYGKAKNKLGVWGLTSNKQFIYLTYIRTPIPFHSNWAGIKALKK